MGSEPEQPQTDDAAGLAEAIELGGFHSAILDNAAVWINVLDAEARVVFWNQAAERISGYPRDEVLGHGRIWEWLYPDPDYRATITAKVARILSRGDTASDFETRIRTRDGEERIINWNSRQLFDTQGQLAGSTAIGQDITERRLAEETLREREHQLSTLVGNLPGMAYRCRLEPHWQMDYVSPGSLALTGYRPEELMDGSQPFAELIHPDDRERIWEESQAIGPENPRFSHEYRIQRKDGGLCWVWEQGTLVSDEEPPVLEGILLDVTVRKRMEQKLQFFASHDGLTGLFNRHELLRLLGNDLQRARRYDHPLSVLLLDVDHFKSVNDYCGHQAGDRVLQQLGQLLQTASREVDYVARYGGEEFVVVLPEAGNEEAAEAAERLRQAVAKELFDLGDGRGAQHMTISIGVASCPEHGHDARELFHAADQAMYRAKHSGRNQVQVATEADRRLE